MKQTMVRVAVLIGLLASACGDDGAGSPFVGGGPVDQGPTPTESSGPALICEDPAPVRLEVGSSLDGNNDASHTVCFTFDAPDGLASLTVSLTGLSDDLSLGVSLGEIDTIQYPGIGEYWRSNEGGTADESLTIEEPAGGTYWIAVGPVTIRNLSSFTLAVTGS